MAEIRPPSKVKQVSDMVVVNIVEKEQVVTREFRIQAVVEYPTVWRASGDEAYMWGYAFRGRREMPGSTVTGASFFFTDIACGGVSRYGIFSHPPCQGGVGYTFGIMGPIVTPDENCEFRTFIGLKDGSNPSDGVLFSVVAQEEDGTETVLAKELWDKQEWKAMSAGLSAFKGKSIRLKLIADSCTNEDSSAGWASWGEPRIVSSDAVMRIEVSHT